MTAVNLLVGLNVPRLHVPDEIKVRAGIYLQAPTPRSYAYFSDQPSIDRAWLVDPLNMKDWWVPLASGLPAIFLTILVFMDQQITATIVSRKDNRLMVSFCSK